MFRFISAFLFMLLPSSEARIGEDENSSSFSPRIVGGYVVNTPDKYPYIVSIMERDFWSGSYRHSCAGTLIAPDVVLTAAHCVEYGANRIIDTGRLSWNDDYNTESLRISGVYKHPDFRKQFYSHDVALLKLDGKASSKLARLKIGERIVDSGDTISIAGWGLTSEYGRPSADLREAQVKVLSYKDCQYYYGQYFSESMMCAYGNGQDACQGDSGGPALIRSSNGATYQVGIVSWGDGCGDKPGVYTFLESPSVVEFINTYMCQKLSPESCINDIFYGPDGTATVVDNVIIESDESESTDTVESGAYDKCKNIDEQTCYGVAQAPWLGCIFSYQACPEICCPTSCDPSVGCYY